MRYACMKRSVEAVQVKAAYRQLDAFHHGMVEGRSSVTALLAESAALQNSQDLFELYVFDHLQLTRCKARLFPGHTAFTCPDGPSLFELVCMLAR